MKPIATATLWSSLTFLVIAVVAGAVGVYGFDGYERAWGRGPSFQVISWVAMFVSVVIGIFAALGFKFARVVRLQKPRVCGVFVGASTGACVVVAAILIPSNSELGGLPLLFTVTLLSSLIAFLVARFDARGDTRAA